MMNFLTGRFNRSHLPTAAGAGAILLWSTTVAVVRSLSEQVGSVTSSAAVYGIGGILALAFLLRSGRIRLVRQFPLNYLAGCGALFVGYMLAIYLAIGLARNRQQVLDVGLLNYLWPVLTLVFSLPLLGKKANWTLIPGTLLALTGVFLVVTRGEFASWQSLQSNLAGNPAAYWLALAAAVAWALYSNLTRKWAGDQPEGAVVVFLPITAIVLFVICLFVDEPRAWNFQSIAEALFLGTSTFLGYMLWDKAMRQGNITMVAAFSYLTPLFSTLISCLYLGIRPGAMLWLGCATLILGSLLSWYAVSRASERGNAALT
jgi:drug/metabolite transporter (DMT)-like permease